MLLAASVLKWPETPTVRGAIHMKRASNANQSGWQHQLKNVRFISGEPERPAAFLVRKGLNSHCCL